MTKFAEAWNEGVAVFGLYCFFLGLVALFGFYAYQKLKKQTGNRFVAGVVVAAFAALAHTAYPTSAEKNPDRTEPIHFLSTDIEIDFLTDKGSYVSKDKVHLDFKYHVLLPPDAMLYLDYIPKSEPLDSNNYTTRLSGRLSDFMWRLPIEFDFENAYDNRWVFYTTYTPGPNVHTNGVAVAEFIKAKKYDNVAVPKRSTIWENGKRIYPEKEKFDLLNQLGD